MKKQGTKMVAFSSGLWPAFLFVLVGFWLWMLLHHCERISEGGISVSGPTYRSAEAEDTLVAIMSFGCTIPGVPACRIMENAKDHIASIVTRPLLLCNGRFGAGVALTILFFGDHALPVALAYFAVSAGAMLLATWVLNRFFFPREPGGCK
jgi:hypothetical protein